MNTFLDVRRHLELFDPYTFDTPVTVIGAGATGSWLTLCLAKLGITNITVWDFDRVEEHNIPNQFYSLDKVGEPKVDALKNMVKYDTGADIKAMCRRFTNQRLNGIVFLMVDSMQARKDIWENSIKMKPNVKLLVEPRMGLNEGRIYNVDPLDLNHIKKYEACWYSDDEAEVSACGTSQTVITTAMTVASMCVRQLLNLQGGISLDNEILLDLQYNGIYPTQW